MQSQFEKLFLAKLESFHQGLSIDPGVVRSLEVVNDQALEFLLEATCQSQRTEANTLGTKYLLRLPRAWILERIEQAVQAKLNLGDDYEFRRLLDLYEQLAKQDEQMLTLLDKLIDFGRKSANADIRQDSEALHKKLQQRRVLMKSTWCPPGKRYPVDISRTEELTP
jgi:hypothetical protein